MAEHPELWTEKTPEPRYLFDRQPTFGLAREAEQMRQGIPPARRVGRKPRRDMGPFLNHLRLPWSYGDGQGGERWHRMRCRLGRHEMAGGHTMQLGSAVVFIERRCRWCESAPA